MYTNKGTMNPPLHPLFLCAVVSWPGIKSLSRQVGGRGYKMSLFLWESLKFGLIGQLKMTTSVGANHLWLPSVCLVKSQECYQLLSEKLSVLWGSEITLRESHIKRPLGTNLSLWFFCTCPVILCHVTVHHQKGRQAVTAWLFLSALPTLATTLDSQTSASLARSGLRVLLFVVVFCHPQLWVSLSWC